MKKVAILGCENSHADNFLTSNITNKKYADEIEFVGVFSEYDGAAERLNKLYGVPVMESFDSLVGEVDAIMITARHGNRHYKYAKPYISSGIPMFIDKPITADCGEAVEFMKKLKANGVSFVGGSSCVHADLVRDVGTRVKSGELGRIYGGYLRAPVSLVNEYGGFWFYSQHLVQVMMSVFGYYPRSVIASVNNKVVTATVKYDEYDISIEFVDGNYIYYINASAEKAVYGGEYKLENVFEREFDEFYELVTKGTQPQSYSDFIAPVFVIDALKRAIESGKEEAVCSFGEI